MEDEALILFVVKVIWVTNLKLFVQALKSFDLLFGFRVYDVELRNFFWHSLSMEVTTSVGLIFAIVNIKHLIVVSKSRLEF